MKSKALFTASLGLSASVGFAFELPRGVYEVAELEQARSKAAERPEMVSFLISKVSLGET